MRSNPISILLIFFVAGCSEYSDYWTNNNEKISTPDGITIFVEKSDIVERGFFFSGHRGAETISRQILPYKISEYDDRLFATPRGKILCDDVDRCDNFPRKYFLGEENEFGISYEGNIKAIEYSNITELPFNRSDSVCMSDTPPSEMEDVIKIQRHKNRVKYTYRKNSIKLITKDCYSFKNSNFNFMFSNDNVKIVVSDVIIISESVFCAIYVGVNGTGSVSFAKDVCFYGNSQIFEINDVMISDKIYSRGSISYFIPNKYRYIYKVDAICSNSSCGFKIKAYSNKAESVVDLELRELR
jgi:hypothetical protein